MLGAIASIAVNGGVYAATVSVRCDLSPTTALATAISSNPAGTVFAITGICQQSLAIAESLSLVNHLDTSALQTGDGIQGEFVIDGTGFVVINGITLEGTTTDTGLPDVLEVNGTPTVVIENAQIIDGQRAGLNVNGSATIEMLNTAVSGNGIANIAGETDGIRAIGAALQFGSSNSDGTVNTGNAVTITNNIGNGIALMAHSHLAMVGARLKLTKATKRLSPVRRMSGSMERR